MRKANKMKGILVALAAGALATLEILDELWPHTSKSHYSNTKRGIKRANNAVELQRFYNTLNYLKKERLIEKQNNNKCVIWKITSSGLNKLNLIQKNIIDYKIE